MGWRVIAEEMLSNRSWSTFKSRANKIRCEVWKKGSKTTINLKALLNGAAIYRKVEYSGMKTLTFDESVLRWYSKP